MKTPETLLEEESPITPVTAVVEQDDRVAFFYLWGPEGSEFDMKACWIRNLQEAPLELEGDFKGKGIPLMQPREFCKYPQGQAALNPDDLSIIWLEEGDGAALLSDGEVIAVITSWSGYGGFHGYARDAQGEGPFAWGMPDSVDLQLRINEAASYWDSWEEEFNPFWKEQPRLLDAYEEQLGKSELYYAIDGDRWPPRGLYVREGESKTLFATVGLSLLAMPLVETCVDERKEWNRIELGFMINSPLADQEVDLLAAAVSAASVVPWNQLTFLNEGHTLGFQLLDSPKFSFALLTNQLKALPKVDLGQYRGSSINHLWLVPISEAERDFAVNEGSAELLKRLDQMGEAIFDRDRAECL